MEQLAILLLVALVGGFFVCSVVCRFSRGSAVKGLWHSRVGLNGPNRNCGNSVANSRPGQGRRNQKRLNFQK